MTRKTATTRTRQESARKRNPLVLGPVEHVPTPKLMAAIRAMQRGQYEEYDSIEEIDAALAKAVEKEKRRLRRA